MMHAVVTSLLPSGVQRGIFSREDMPTIILVIRATRDGDRKKLVRLLEQTNACCEQKCSANEVENKNDVEP